MRLTVDWQTEGNQATIRQGGVVVARLFGVPFLLFGGYLVYQFLDGAMHPGELTLPGWVGLPLISAALIVPGWILVAGRKRTRIDRARREVIEEFDYLVYTRRTVSPLSANSKVLLRYEEGSTSSTRGAVTTHASTRYDIHVYVTDAGTSMPLIGLFSEQQKPEAMAFAAKAAGFLGIGTQNCMIEGGAVNSGGVVVEHLDPEDSD